MAQYFNDFSQYTVDTEPADFTRRWESNLIGTVRDDAGAQNGRVLDVVQSGSGGRNLLSWDAIDADTDRDNVETLVRFFKPVAASDARSALRASGTGSETGYTAGYSGNDDAIRHGRYTNGSFSNRGTLSLNIPTGAWYYQRVRLFGSTLKTKVWPDDGTTEPEGWNLEESDSFITQNGWVGLFAFSSSSQTLFDFFSVGTNGDSAPTEPLSTSTDIQLVSTSNSITSISAAMFQQLNADALAVSQSLSQSDVQLLFTLASQSTSQSINSGTVYLDSVIASDSFSEASSASTLGLVQGMIANAPSASDVTGLLGLISGIDASSISESSASALLEFASSILQLSAASDSQTDSNALITFITNLVAHSEAFLDSETLMSLTNYISAMSTTDSNSVSALGLVANLFSNTGSVSNTESLLGNIIGIEANTITVSELFGLAQLELSLNGDIKAASQLAGVLDGIIDRIGYLTIDELNIGLLMEAGVDLNVVLDAQLELRNALDAEIKTSPKR